MILVTTQPLGRRANRTAFTLVELLVVMAIIAVLISLLVPAVQKVRSASARTSCSNNLKQFCLGLHNYAGVHGNFPGAYTSTGTNPGWGWGAAALPYIEQDNLYQTAGVETRLFGDGANPALPDAFSTHRVGLFRCPSDTGPTLNPFRLDHAMSNYRAVAGAVTTPFFSADLDLGGVMYQNSKTKVGDVTDGTSATVIVGECMFDEQSGKWAALWSGMSGLRGGSIYISDVMWWIDQAAAVINGPAPQAFSSRHSGGAYFGFCDGSVRFFHQGGDPDIIRWLGCRNDGNIVTTDF